MALRTSAGGCGDPGYTHQGNCDHNAGVSGAQTGLLIAGGVLMGVGLVTVPLGFALMVVAAPLLFVGAILSLFKAPPPIHPEYDAACDSVDHPPGLQVRINLIKVNRNVYYTYTLHTYCY